MPPPNLVKLPRGQTRLADALQRQCAYSKPESVDATRRLLHLCKAADLTNESLYGGPALERALWRYEALWLPLLVALAPPLAGATVTHSTGFARVVEEVRRINYAKGGVNLERAECVPPVDVAWVWHCHRLSPKAYKSDMESLVDCGGDGVASGCLDTGYGDSFRFSDGEDGQSQRVRALWEAVFVDEPYTPPYIVRCSWEEDVVVRRQGISSYLGDLGRASFKGRINRRAIEKVSAAQKTFLRQVVGLPGQVAVGGATEELCETNEWLGRAWDRYLLWLNLWKTLGEDAELVPMSDINVAWHAHLSCTGVYKKDCETVLGWVLDHDTEAVEDRRERRNLRAQKLLEFEENGVVDASDDEDEVIVQGRGEGDEDVDFEGTSPTSGDDDVASLGLPRTELDELDTEEVAALLEKRRRGFNLRPTKNKWEAEYGANPKYDLPDTRYRGEAEGERGGFRDVFVLQNGTVNDISWVRALAAMLFAAFVFLFGAMLVGWAFFKTMLKDGRYVVGVPTGVIVMGLGFFAFLSIPVNRPLSSDARYWHDRDLKQTHNPLPPYLISSTKKVA